MSQSEKKMENDSNLLSTSNARSLRLSNTRSLRLSKGASLILIAIFLGCGLLDVVLNYVQTFHLQHLSTSLFSAFGLGMAGVFGGIILLINILRKKETFEKKSIIAGILLGIPNYFSIYYLIQSYSSTSWSDSTVLAVLNVATVISSTLAGLVLFKEKLNLQKSAGLVLSLLAIACFYFS